MSIENVPTSAAPGGRGSFASDFARQGPVVHAAAGPACAVTLVHASTTACRIEPAAGTARFEQTGRMPQNVQSREVPSGIILGSTMVGPFSPAASETYDIVIDDRFADGVHRYGSPPREAPGTTGGIVIG